MKTETKSFKKYKELCKQRKAWTKSDIMGFCWAINGVKNVNLGENSLSSRQQLLDYFTDKNERSITKEQTKQGIAWLKKYAFTDKGSVRKQQDNPLTEYELNIIKNFSRFKLVGLFGWNVNYYRDNPTVQASPIYRVYSKDGRYFDYTIGGQWAPLTLCSPHDQFYGF